MDPMQGSFMNPGMLPISGFVFAPGIFASDHEGEEFLSSLDSDTRNYVIEHTDEFRTRQDIVDCIDRLHGKS